jgi:hypothetical protein
VQSPGTLDTERIPWAGRHRLAAKPRRKAALRAALVVGVLLATALLGLLTAGALGLTGLPMVASDESSAPDASDVLPVAPEFERTVDMDQPAPHRPSPSASPVVPDPPAAQPATEPPPELVAADAPSPENTPAPAATVRPGDPCPAKDATGLTPRGKQVVCRGGHGRLRWRVA